MSQRNDALDEVYDFGQLADRIHAVLGERPSPSTLRAAAASADRGTNSRIRLTAGMPAPLPERVGRRRVFAAAAVEQWLQRHPRTVVRTQLAALADTPVPARPAAVQRARQAGLSWQQIAAACAAADGVRYSRQWAQQKYGGRATVGGQSTA